MAGGTQRTQLLLLLFGGTIFLAISFAGADPYAGCGNACNCPNRQSCTSGANKNCCWSSYNNKCSKVNFLTDRDNCGHCNNKCKDYETCCKGSCLTKSAFRNDPYNCGECNNKCRGYTKCCRGVCKNPANCGECGNKCKHGQVCCNGSCVNLQYDNRNCGRCGRKCDHPTTCKYGSCVKH